MVTPAVWLSRAIANDLNVGSGPSIPLPQDSREVSPLIFGPIYDSKTHIAPKHFGFQIGGMRLPIGRFANLERRILSGGFLRVVRRESAANTLIHHGEALVRESSMIGR